VCKYINTGDGGGNLENKLDVYSLTLMEASHHIDTVSISKNGAAFEETA